MRKIYKERIGCLLICVLVFIALIGIDYVWMLPAKDDYVSNDSQMYDCNYKTLSFNTNIVTTIDGEEYSVTGNVFKIVTDPLTLKNSAGKTVGYAGDAYGFVTQDDHAIYIDDEFVFNMVGNFAIFIDSYTIKNANGEVIAKGAFNTFNTFGKITNNEGKVIATYSSMPFFNDFKIKTYKNDTITDDRAIFMIMSSFVSDRKADSNSSSSKSKNK